MASVMCRFDRFIEQKEKTEQIQKTISTKKRLMLLLRSASIILFHEEWTLLLE